MGFIRTIALILTLAAPAQAQQIITSPPRIATGWQVVTVIEDLFHPWGLDWLPSGEMLITTRNGRLYRYANGSVTRVKMPELTGLFAQNQGGLLDIAVGPTASRSGLPLVYMTMSTGSLQANRTTLVRGVYDAGRINGLETIFRVSLDKNGGEHFGSRIAWLPDETLLMSVGDGGNPPRVIGGMLARNGAQDLERHLGKILRLNADGRAPRDNPFVGRTDAKPEIWSYGHRNIQGLAVDSRTGRVWSTEHGPRGGDELNLVTRGANFGWPLASYGKDYVTNQPIGVYHVDGAEDPLVVWRPTSVAPSGLTVYHGDRFPAWRGDLFSGNLVDKDIHRIIIDETGAVTGVERLPIGERVRDVRTGPDGYLYVLTDEDNGKLLRIEPR